MLTVQQAVQFFDKSGHFRPIKPPTEYVAGYQSKSGRQIALLCKNSEVTLFMSDGEWISTAPPLKEIVHYPAQRGRNSNLTANAPMLRVGYPIVKVVVASQAALEQLCAAYEGIDIQSEAKVEGVKMEAVSAVVESVPLNQILFGPPGTGKTYHTIDKALAILDPTWLAANETDRKALKMRFDELVKEGRIDFVTFHQSFSYEDFVEGIRADSNADGQLVYKVEPGVLKRLCDDARDSIVPESYGVRNKPRIWKISIDGTGSTATKTYCLEQGEARIGWGNTGDLQTLDEQENSYYQKLGTNDRSTLNSFSQEMVVGDLLVCIRSAEQIEAIGVVTGDYRFETSEQIPAPVREDYCHVRPVKWLFQNVGLSILPLNDNTRFTLKTVYAMDRFSWGDLLAYLQENNKQLVGVSQPLQNKEPYVLVIDEINRGNISRIFGELITLIEPSKRAGAREALSTTLPYSKRPFSVPDNLYLIGTMNTADRSLAGLDIALRRRFVFEEMPSRPDLLDGVEVEGVNIGELLRVMNQRIELLLDRDHCLGHAYLMPLDGKEKPTLTQLGTIFRTQLLPLLQEYFFEDWQRIAWVLNDHRKGTVDQFLQAPQVDVSALFGDQVPVGNHRQRWTLNESAFARIGAYSGIIKVVAKGGPAESATTAAPEPAFEEEQVAP